MTMRASLPQRQFTGNHMLLLVVGFFGVIVAVNVGMAVVASTSWTGLVVDNSYVASQRFEEKRLAHEAQLAAGWRATFSYAPGMAQLAIVDGTGEPVDLGKVTLHVNRPVGGHEDRKLDLERSWDGSYAAALELAPGTWDARVAAAMTPKGPFELHQRFRVDGAEP